MTAEDAANLICYQKVVRSVSVMGDRTHALTAEGHDASEDGTGRGTPIVAVPAIAATLTSNLVAFDPKAGGDHTSSGAFEDGLSGQDEVLVVGSLTASHGGADDNDAMAGHLVTYQKVVRSGAHASGGNLPPEVWAERDVAATLSPVDLVVSARSLAVRGREGGSACELGPENGPAFTLRAGDGGSSRSQLIAISTRGDQPDPLPADDVVETVVRRLTPLECERLQGAPDGWTEGQSDSARYRQLGNAVAVPVFEWVGRRLSEVDATLTACRYTQYPEVTS